MKLFVAVSFVLALIGSLLLNAGLFSFLPLMGYWNAHRSMNSQNKISNAHLVSMTVLQKKKEKPKTDESKKNVEKKMVEPGKSISRQRFVMDLGPGGGSVGGVGASVNKSDLEQVSYGEGETDVDAKVLKQVAPKKPKQAESAGISGLVRCVLTVGEDGKVADIQFLEVPGNYGFEDAVREAVREWRYQPAMNAGIPVRQRIEQPFNF